MSKLLVVFGATGQQGGSVADYVVADSELSKEFKVRAVTRDTSKPAAQALQQKGVEVVQGDAEEPDSLKRILEGAHTVFTMTNSIYDGKTTERELKQGKSVADAAVAAGAQYIIFSSLDSVTKISGGKYTKVEGFDAKAEVEAYIRTLPIKSAFFAPGSFMQNFHTVFTPRPTGDGTYAIANVSSPQSKLPLIEVVADTGKYVGAILANPDKYEGKVFCASTEVKSLEEIAQIMSKASGKTVKYSQLPTDVYRSFMPQPMADQITEMMLYVNDFGYYGADTEKLVEWTAAQARGKLTTLEEYFEKNPLNVD